MFIKQDNGEVTVCGNLRYRGGMLIKQDNGEETVCGHLRYRGGWRSH